MTSASATSRREFLVLASLSGAALVLQSCRSPLPPDATGAAAAAGAFRPDLWLSILPDGSVEFAVTRLEMGQGIRTGLTILVAEELAMAPERIRLRSPTTAELPEAGVILETGSSDSTSDHWVPLREAAAAAREMLVAAAAARWQVEPGACALVDGRVVHRDGARDVRGVRGVRSIGIGELAAEAARLPVPKHPRPREAGEPSEFRFIGKPTRRLEGPEIVTGKPRFAADVRLENQLYAVLCRPPVTGGRARGFDPAPALAVPGVRHVVAVDSSWAVVAGDTWSALRGREALAIEWEDGPAAEFSSAAFGRGLDEALTVETSAGAYQRPVGEQARAIVVTPGTDDLPAMPTATPSLEARYSTGFQTHMPMEPLNATARCDGDRCEIWVGHQKPHEVVAAVAARLGLAPDRVVVHPLPMGGGFGGREQAAFAVEAAVLAREMRGTPVQVFWTRADDLGHSTYHPASRHLLQGWLDAKGRLAAWRHRVASPSIEIQWGRSFHSVGKAEATGAWNLPYTCANVRVEYADLRVPVPLGFWRGVEIMFNNFAVESFIDELALQAGRDPLEFRLAHLGEA
ncbi:MAG: isoquinoline 1-oxidoreductase subunit beta, partial [Acidobacteriota bacterium]|nr:isoquinoline 1-oxidoreductase subunit beta [Acidobacteriota bacterium]